MDGAHTHGSGGVVELAVVGAAGMAGLGIAAYVAPRLAWVLGTVAVCAVLTVAAVVALMRWMPAVRVWSQPPAQLTAERIEQVGTPSERDLRKRDSGASITAGQSLGPAVEQHVHYHYHAADGQQSRLPLDPLPGRQHLLRVEPAGAAAGRVQGDGHERVDDSTPQV